jgi:hypothetical protein
VALSTQTKSALKQLNQQASRTLAKGNYAAAQAMVEQARSIQGFQVEVRNLQQSWRRIKKSPAGTNAPETTPRWEYYKPILGALASLGGQASRTELEGKLDGRIQEILKTGDFALNSQGIPRWKIEVRRARKAMIHQGFLEAVKGKWIITKTGERAATSRAE